MSKIKSKTYIESNHIKNNYKNSVGKMTHDEIYKEYNKLRLLLNMMRIGHKKGLEPYMKGRDNIKMIKYKYNIICNEITKRHYSILGKDYKRYNARYKSL